MAGTYPTLPAMSAPGRVLGRAVAIDVGHRRDTMNTLTLHTRTLGRGSHLVLLHGFTQTSVSWEPVTERLLPGHQVTTVDLPGHGASTETGADLADTARLVVESTGPSVLVGYSMGGRVALRVALDHPQRVRALVLIGATAGIDDPGERAERRHRDEVLARNIETDGTGPFVRRWMQGPLFRHLVPRADDLEARLANPAAGLAESLRRSGTGTMDPPWWNELARISAPVLVMAGTEDPKFTALGHRMVDAIGPSARFAPVAGAGHAAHLEQPSAVAALIAEFAGSLPPAAGEGPG